MISLLERVVNAVELRFWAGACRYVDARDIIRRSAVLMVLFWSMAATIVGLVLTIVL